MNVVQEVSRIRMKNGEILPCVWKDDYKVYVCVGKFHRGRVYPYTVHHFKGVAILEDGKEVQGARPAPVTEQDLCKMKKYQREDAKKRHLTAYES